MSQKRDKIPLSTQIHVYFRDRWLCHWCRRPLIFGPALRYLEALVTWEYCDYPVSYFDSGWRRDRAPLLDELGAVVDHVEAHAAGGVDDCSNLVAACNKCNAHKNSRPADDFVADSRFRPVKGRYGEPRQWDGLVSFFVTYGRRHPDELTPQDRAWLRCIERYLRQGSDEVTPVVGAGE
jgi:hypothetical protein